MLADGNGFWSDADAFADLSGDEREALAQAASVVAVSRGDVLIREGDQADALYLVASGRFHVHLKARDEIVAEIGPGEPIGELAFFAGGTRSASVIAARDGSVLKLTRERYEELIARMPSLAEHLMRSMARRLLKVAAVAPELKHRPPRMLAFLAIDDAPLPGPLLAALAEALGSHGRARVLRPQDVPDDVARADDTALARWLQRVESEHAFVLCPVEGEEGWRRCLLRNSDAIVLVGRLDPRREAPLPPREFERFAADLFPPANRTLLMWRERSTDAIAGTRPVLDPRQVALHHHVALDSRADMARLARFVAGRALGVVLSGGGALGCAHIGIVRALLEAGVPVDYYGGTSSGAAMAGAYAKGEPPASLMDKTESIFIDNRALGRRTLPVYSLLDHEVFDELLAHHYCETDIVDLPTHFYALSTNLTRSEPYVHRRGPLWRAIRSSGSIPGMLPPFASEEGDLLVDGGLIDNTPVSVMREIKAGPNVTAIFVERGSRRPRSSYEELPGRLKLARELVTWRHRRHHYPRVNSVLMNSLQVAARRALRETDFTGEAVIATPTLPGVTLLDWRLGRQQAEHSYRHTLQLLEEAGGIEGLIARGASAPAKPGLSREIPVIA